MTNPAELFWSRIDRRGPDDCWPWLGGLSGPKRHSVPYMTISGKTYYARRIAYAIARPGRLTKTMRVSTSCGSETCLNPAHLQTKFDRRKPKTRRYSWGTPAQRRSIERLAVRWQDPEFRQLMSEKLKAGWVKRRERLAGK